MGTLFALVGDVKVAETEDDNVGDPARGCMFAAIFSTFAWLLIIAFVVGIVLMIKGG